jgi:hypothetical protein
MIILFTLDYYHHNLHCRHSSEACALVYALKKTETRFIYHLLADVTASAPNLDLLFQIAFAQLSIKKKPRRRRKRRKRRIAQTRRPSVQIRKKMLSYVPIESINSQSE